MIRFILCLLIFLNTHSHKAQDSFPEELKEKQKRAFKLINNNPKLAKSLLQENLEWCLKNNHTKRTIQSYRYLSYCEKRLGNYPQSLKHLFDALRESEKVKDTQLISVAYTDIATIMRFQKNYTASLSYYDKAIDLNIAIQDSLNLALNNEMKGTVYSKMNEHEVSLNCYKKAETLFKKLNKPRGLLRVRLSRAKVLTDLGQYDESLNLYYEDLALVKEQNNERYLVSCYGNMAKNYSEKKQYEKAISYLDSAIYLSSKNGYTERLSANLLERSDVYKQMKLYSKALEDYKAYKSTYDSVFNNKNEQKIAELLLQHEYEQKRVKDNLVFQMEKTVLQNHVEAEKTKKNLFLVIIILILLGISILALYFRNILRLNREQLKKEELERDLFNERLESLTLQLNLLKSDNEMRREFKQKLLGKIKILKEETNSKNLNDISSLITDLQTQIHTEQRLDKKNKLILESSPDSFESKLISLFPTLTVSEIEICKLIKMNLSTKEIMNVQDSTLASVKSSRYRIRKKMNIPQGEEIEKFLKTFGK